MRDTDLAYLAGIVDGEGSIELKLFKQTTLDLVLHVFNSDKPLFDWIEATFGGKTYDIHRRARVERPQWAPVYNWNTARQAARDLLGQLLPYLLIKRAQAELAIEAWDNRQPSPRTVKGVKGGRPRPSEEVIALRKSYVERMHALNTKNRGPMAASQDAL